jgi:hypothetical protein
MIIEIGDNLSGLIVYFMALVFLLTLLYMTLKD